MLRAERRLASLADARRCALDPLDAARAAALLAR